MFNRLFVRKAALLAAAMVMLSTMPAAAETVEETAVLAATEVAAGGVQPFRTTGLPVPRFVSLRADTAYVRAGPALRYPVKWVYRRDRLPVEIVQEFENWRKIRDHDGEEGWIHQSLLSGQRTAIIAADAVVLLRDNYSDNARPVARVEPNVVADIQRCEGGWCRIAAGSYRGWIERNLLWGIYPEEELN